MDSRALAYLSLFAEYHDRLNYTSALNTKDKIVFQVPFDISSIFVNSGFGYSWSGLSVTGASASNDLCKKFVDEVLPETKILSKTVAEFK